MLPAQTVELHPRGGDAVFVKVDVSELGERLPSRELNVLVTTLILANRAGGIVVGKLGTAAVTVHELFGAADPARPASSESQA